MSDQIVAEDVWAADMLYGSEPSSAPPTEYHDDDVVAESARASAGSGVGGESFELESASRHEPEADVNAGAKRTAIALGAGVACAVAVTAAVLMMFRDAAPAPQTSAPTPVLVAAPPSQPASAPAAESDQAIPYTASANCPTGSTSAQALTEATGDSAWVCVRGLQGATVDGQVLRVDFGGSYVLSAVSVTPGWVAKAPGGKDEWLQHRVVSRLQYMFNDTDRTIVTQDTANTRGPVTTALAKKVMASAVTVVILQTSRPPSSPPPPVEPDAIGAPGFGDSMLGPDGAPLSSDATSITDPLASGAQDGDPVDATFALSELKFLGHEPN